MQKEFFWLKQILNVYQEFLFFLISQALVIPSFLNNYFTLRTTCNTFTMRLVWMQIRKWFHNEKKGETSSRSRVRYSPAFSHVDDGSLMIFQQFSENKSKSITAEHARQWRCQIFTNIKFLLLLFWRLARDWFFHPTPWACQRVPR